MSQSAQLGKNRTGIAQAPELARDMVAATREFPPSSQGSAEDLAAVRAACAEAWEPAGTLSAPAGMLDKAKMAGKAATGAQPTVFMDKLGERLAFERSGVRLYEALLSKHRAYGAFEGGPDADDLQHICDEEHRHFQLLSAAIEQLRGDPTAVTPSANLHAAASAGIVAVLADPRTSLLQCLEAILVAELADNDGWEALCELARKAGEDELT
ncbi:MAG: ferritin-like domain-containing protein, partial [Candidatus Rokuibacteriota bacterium]